MSHYQEIWISGPDGQSLCALINGEQGWLMYLRHEGDAGFSSRNPDYNGEDDAEIEYILNNGQQDWYPACWALPLPIIREALEYFRTEGTQPPFILWHDDSGDESIQ